MGTGQSNHWSTTRNKGKDFFFFFDEGKFFFHIRERVPEKQNTLARDGGHTASPGRKEGNRELTVKLKSWVLTASSLGLPFPWAYPQPHPLEIQSLKGHRPDTVVSEPEKASL